MSYTLSIPDGKRYVLVTASGAFSRDLAIEVAINVTRLARANNLHRALFDMRASRNIEPTTMNYYYAHADLTDLRVNRDTRVAILVAPDDHSHDFAERAMREAGYDVALFRDEAAALTWLEG
jgi:hypothetical protein